MNEPVFILPEFVFKAHHSPQINTGDDPSLGAGLRIRNVIWFLFLFPSTYGPSLSFNQILTTNFPKFNPRFNLMIINFGFVVNVKSFLMRVLGGTNINFLVWLLDGIRPRLIECRLISSRLPNFPDHWAGHTGAVLSAQSSQHHHQILWLKTNQLYPIIT